MGKKNVLLQCALRETEEEAGLRQEVLQFVKPEFKIQLKYKVTSHRDGIERHDV